MKTPARVAIVGRPNVGKSTLFNRIVGKRSALVHPQPGVTRDIQRAEADWNGVVFEIIDTGGLFSGVDDGLVHEVEKRALHEALTAEALIFLTDAVTGVTAGDLDVAEQLRSVTAPVLLTVNKTEKQISKHAASEFFRLGFENVFAISALHGEGIGDLLDELVARLPKRQATPPGRDLKLAVVGRPNVGKSSIVNRIVGSEANIVDSRPGTTRDCIDTVVRWQGRKVVLVDTAGIKRRSRTKDGLTALTALKAIDAITRAEVVVMVLDASREVAMQDVKVASYAHKAAKGIMFCVNKWDLLDKDNATAPDFEKKIRRSFAFLKYAPILFTSALEGQRISRIFPLAWRIKESRESRVPTSEVNKFLEEIVARTPPPSHGGGNGRIYYITQAEIAPPTFHLSVNNRLFFGRSYLRFLNNRLRDKYGFEGTLIRLRLREH
jgi:GTP-binding protein